MRGRIMAASCALLGVGLLGTGAPALAGTTQADVEMKLKLKTLDQGSDEKGLAPGKRQSKSWQLAYLCRNGAPAKKDRFELHFDDCSDLSGATLRLVDGDGVLAPLDDLGSLVLLDTVVETSKGGTELSRLTAAATFDFRCNGLVAGTYTQIEDTAGVVTIDYKTTDGGVACPKKVRVNVTAGTITQVSRPSASMFETSVTRLQSLTARSRKARVTPPGAMP